MNQYIKPTIKLIGSATNSSRAVSCHTTKEDMDIISSIVGSDNMDKAFGMNEGCTIPVQMYCKFTSVELGAAQAFTS